jgi:hypothetical protein
MIIRLRSKRLAFKSTCNRCHMHCNYTSHAGDHRLDHQDNVGDDRKYSTQLYPIPEIVVVDRIMDKMKILDHGVIVVVDDHVPPPLAPHYRLVTTTSNGGSAGGHNPYIKDDDNSYACDGNDSDDDSYYHEGFTYSDSEDDDEDDGCYIPISQELVISMLADVVGCGDGCHYSTKFQKQIRQTPNQRKNHFNSENDIRNAAGAPPSAAAVVHDSASKTGNISIARSPHNQKIHLLGDKKYEPNHHHHQHEHEHQHTQQHRLLAASIEVTIVPASKNTAKKNKTDEDSQPTCLHHYHHSSSSSSCISVLEGTTSPERDATAAGSQRQQRHDCRRRHQRNHAMSQTDFCEVLDRLFSLKSSSSRSYP